MNTKEYIESGIIETCILGLAYEAEQQEFNALCIQYPEISEARIAFERALEDQLMKEAITPPVGLKEKILSTLNIPGTNGVSGTKDKYIVPVQRINVWKWMTAACILLLAGVTYWAYSVNYNYQELLTTTIEKANQIDHSSHADAIILLKGIVEKPTVKWSTMVEPANTSHCMAHIYWDSLSKNTYLLLGNIPKSVSEKQFQLWAVVNNRAVSLGTFDVKKEGQLIQMKDILKAKAFSITIEPKGGSVIPNTNATYAIGEL